MLRISKKSDWRFAHLKVEFVLDLHEQRRPVTSIVDTNTKLDTNTIVVSVTKLTPIFPIMHHSWYAGDGKDADAKCNM